MVRRLYRCLLWLHPASFREQFADEMLWIFDEASGVGAAAFFADGFTSLARQWMLRTGMWKAAVAGVSSLVLFSVIAGMVALPVRVARFHVADIDSLDYPMRYPPVSPAQFNGHWAGNFLFPGPAGQMEFTLRQTEGVWSGDLWIRGADGVMHPGVPEDIQVGGDALSFHFKTNRGEMVYRGRMIEGGLHGYVRAASE